MEYTTNDSQIQVENTNLKQIIRENDNRIFYLERKLDNATQIVNCLFDDGSIHIGPILCYSCRHIYLYDEHTCNCNIFCRKSLCKECYQYLKTETEEVLVCQHSKCKNWYCDREKCFLKQCKDCERKLCTKHYDYSNMDNNSWICKECCEKAKTDYGFETVGFSL